MAYYAGAKGNESFHIREERRRWEEHLKKHNKKLQRAKPTISNTDRNYQQGKVNYKKLQHQEDRLSNINYRNQRLNERLEKIGKRNDDTTWNEQYSPRYKQKRTPRAVTEPSSDEEEDEESDISLTSETEEELRTTETGQDYESSTTERPETSSEIMDDVRQKEQREIDEEKDKIKSTVDSQRQPGYYRESTDEFFKRNRSIRENHVLEKRLSHLLKLDPNSKIKGEYEHERLVRKKTLEDARAAVKRENELLKNGTARDDSAQSREEYDERVIENMRLHRKILDIKKGKGKPSVDDPSYNSYNRWWMTSPRGRDKKKYEEEKQKLIEEIKKRKQEQKKQHLKEQREIAKKIRQEEEERKQEVEKGTSQDVDVKNQPGGKRKKKRKKKKNSSVSFNPEELPDTSITAKDAYENPPPPMSDDE